MTKARMDLRGKTEMLKHSEFSTGKCWQPYSFVNESTGQITFPELQPDAPYNWLLNPEKINISELQRRIPNPYSQTYGSGSHYFTRAGSEDWAQSFVFYIFPEYRSGFYVGINNSPIRKKYVEDQLSKN